MRNRSGKVERFGYLRLNIRKAERRNSNDGGTRKLKKAREKRGEVNGVEEARNVRAKTEAEVHCED